MTSINLKELPSLGTDEATYRTDTDRANGGQHRKLVDSIAGVSVAGRSPERQTPTPVRGFGAAGGLGMW
jgi:hypothetical protein